MQFCGKSILSNKPVFIPWLNNNLADKGNYIEAIDKLRWDIQVVIAWHSDSKISTIQYQ